MLAFNPFTGTLDVVSDPTSTTRLGTIKLAGDLGGTALVPTVLKVNGVTISGVPNSGDTIVASSGTTASWQPPVASTQRTFAYWIAG